MSMPLSPTFLYAWKAAQKPQGINPRHWGWAHLLFLLSMIVFGARGNASLPIRPLSQYTHESWTSEQGLPQNSVNALAQDKEGYLWLATWEGLARFDGIRFSLPDTSNLSGLRGKAFLSLLCSKDGRVWAGNSRGDLLGFRGARAEKRWELGSGSVVALFEDHQGILWIGTEGGGLYQIRADQLVHLNESHGFATSNVSVKAIVEDSQGTLWVATATHGLYQFTHGRFSRITEEKMASLQVNALAVDAQGQVWAGTSGGLFLRRNDGRWDPRTANNLTQGTTILSLCIDQHSQIWMGTESGLIRFFEGKASLMKESDGLTHGYIAALFEDREGSLWVGTTVGLNRLRLPEILSYGKREGLLHDVVETLFQDRDGILWMGHSNGRVSKRAKGLTSPALSPGSLPEARIRTIGQSSDGALWFGTFGSGLARLQNGTVRLFTQKDGLASNTIRSLWGDAAGRMWIGTVDGGLSLYENGAFRTYSTKDGLSSQNVRIIRPCRTGGLWIGTWGNGLFRFDGHRFTPFPLGQGSSQDFITDLWEEPDGTLWVSTNGGGLNRAKNGACKRYSLQDGLPVDQLHTVLDDGLGYLWSSGNKGLLRISKQAFDALDQGRIPTLEPDLFDHLDGMRNREAFGGAPAGVLTDDGHLWFPTIGGAVEVDPSHVRLNRTIPNVVVESLQADDLKAPQSAPFEFPAGTRTIQIQYTAPSLLIPSRIRFQYRLEGFDSDWVDAGKRRTAYYSNLAPGRYLFRVIASNENGVWGFQGASTPFYVRPHFYQRGWVRALAGGILLAAMAWITRIFIRRAQHTHADRIKRESDRRFRALVENSSDGIVLTNSEGEILYVSPAVESILAYTPRELSCTRFEDLIHPEDRPTWESLRQQMLTTQGQAHVYATRFKHLDGRWRLIEGALVNRLDDPAVQGIVMNFRDITERKQLEFQLMQSQKLESIGQLAAGIAHEINTPIQFVGDNLRFLQEAFQQESALILEVENLFRDPATTPEEKAQAFHAATLNRDLDYLKAEIPSALSQSLEGILRVATIVQALKTFSHPDGRDMVLVDVNAAIESTATVARSEWKYVADLQLNLDPDLPKILCHPGELNQAILNLLVNAAHAIAAKQSGGDSEKGLITLQTLALNECVEIRVTDTGTGIPEDIQPRIFDPFFTTKPVGMGTGQGLNLVHAIVVQHHNGSVTFTSEVSKGSTFLIRLPLQQPA